MIAKQIKFESIVSDGEEKLVTSFFSEGTIEFNDANALIRIDFNEPTDDELTLATSLIFAEDNLKIQREGNISMIQEFVVDETVYGTYETEYGELETMSKTHVLEIDANEDSGEIFLEYDFYLNAEAVSTIQISIEYQ